MALKDPDLDLNLLRYLVTLVELGSVSRTADQLGVTQPAVSAALKRLRERFRDPIVVRSGQAIHLTAREFDLLLYLLRQPHQVHERRAILDALWGSDWMGELVATDITIGYAMTVLTIPKSPTGSYGSLRMTAAVPG